MAAGVFNQRILIMYFAMGNTIKTKTHIIKPNEMMIERIFAGIVSLYIFGSGSLREEECQLR